MTSKNKILGLIKMSFFVFSTLLIFSGCNSSKEPASLDANLTTNVKTEKDVKELSKLSTSDDYYKYLNYLTAKESNAENTANEGDKVKAYEELYSLYMQEFESIYKLLYNVMDDDDKASLVTAVEEWKSGLDELIGRDLEKEGLPENSEDLKTIVDDIKASTYEFVEMYYYYLEG